jgi:feruloyl-CoA synthase
MASSNPALADPRERNGEAPPRVRRDDPRFGPLEYVEPDARLLERSDGSFLLRAGWELGTPRRNLVDYLRENADRVPTRTFLAARPGSGNGWHRLGYAEARAGADRIAQALIDRGLGRGDVIAVLAPAGIEHGLLMLGAMTAGVAIAPISPSYAAIAEARQRLVDAFAILKARMLVVADAAALADPLSSLDLEGVELVSIAPHPGTTAFSSLMDRDATAAVEEAYALLDGDTVAKILFTSGSTGRPKGVINTQRMLCANQQMAAELALRDDSDPQVALNWLPWHHTFAGNFVVGDTLRTAGTLYLDDGKPMPGPPFERTLRAIREVRPTCYADVPAGYAMLADAMERDEALRAAFFERLRVMRYGGAALSTDVYEWIQRLAEAAIGRRVPMICAFAMTEAAPSVTALHWPYDGVGCLGLPYAGIEMKLLPLEAGRYEIRLKGPNIFPGYLDAPEQTREAFDEEGFFITGDACRFATPGVAETGLVYDGRVSEEFKLETATWVHVGTIRVGLIEAAAPLLADIVIAGDNRAHVTALAWLRSGSAPSLPSDAGALLPGPALRERLAAALGEWNRKQQGSSRRVERLILMAEPPVFAAGEINDKAYVNQRAVLRRRRDLVERLYAAAGDPAHIDAAH